MPLLFRSNPYVGTSGSEQLSKSLIILSVAQSRVDLRSYPLHGTEHPSTDRFQNHTCMGFTLRFNINLTIGACALAVNV